MDEVTDSDEALVLRAQSGDTDAFGRLVERYMHRADRQALGLVGSREDALDLSQEAFVRAYRARHTIDPGRPFYAWLYRIIRHLCFNFQRDTRVRTRALEEEGAVWLVESAHTTSPGPADMLEQTEVRRQLAAAIQRLPAHEREVLVGIAGGYAQPTSFTIRSIPTPQDRGTSGTVTSSITRTTR